MPSAKQAVDFLIKHDSLRLGETPWNTYTEEDDLYPVDWPRLFPNSAVAQDGDSPWDIFGGDWEPDWDDGFLGELEDIFSNEDIVGDRSLRPAARDDEPGSETGGWDRCAWYQPVHFFGHDWGIFIREECVRRAALDIARHLRGATRAASAHGFRMIAKALWRAGVYVYFLHEHYHHKVESLGFRLHVIDQKSAYLPYKRNVYDACKGKDEQLEEALANADSYQRLSSQPYVRWITRPIVEATREYLKHRFPTDPPGYRNAVDYLKRDKFDRAENMLQARVREATLKPTHKPQDWDLAPRMTQSFLNVRSNIWVVVPRGVAPKIPTAALPAPTCSTREMVGLCERTGYKVVPGGKGSHVKLAKPDAPTIVLPGNRKTLSPGAARTTLRVLGQFKLADLPKLLSGEIRVGHLGTGVAEALV